MIGFDIFGAFLSCLCYLISYGENQPLSIHDYVIQFPFQNRTAEVHSVAEWNHTTVFIFLFLGFGIGVVIPCIAFYTESDDDADMHLAAEISNPKVRQIVWWTRILMLLSAGILIVCFVFVPNDDQQTLDNYHLPFLWNCSAPCQNAPQVPLRFVSCSYGPTGTDVTIKVPTDSHIVVKFHNLLQILLPISFSCGLFALVFLCYIKRQWSNT
jgi:hypothetical protein